MNAAFLVSAPVGGGGSSFLYNAWQQNTAIRFGTSGILGNAIFFGLDRILFPVILNAAGKSASDNMSKWIIHNAASVSFFVAYLLDIAIQHILNAWLVFGLESINTRQLYLSSLALVSQLTNNITKAQKYSVIPRRLIHSCRCRSKHRIVSHSSHHHLIIENCDIPTV